MTELPRLGARGGGWVALQSVLMPLIVVAGVTGPGWPAGSRPWLALGGTAVGLGGALLGLAATRALGKSLTAFPRPATAGMLVEHGPYRFVRHPVYSGGTLFFVGLSLAMSPWALVATGVLTVVWGLKARVEERLLLERYPEYGEYCRRTRSRLVPFVY